MGAWDYIRPILQSAIDGRWPLLYTGRARNSSPSEGSSAIHAVHQKMLVEQAYTVGASGAIDIN